MSRNDVILGIVAAVLVAFSLVVAIVLPRRSPNFPGKHVGRIVAIGAALIIAMLAAVEVLGETHHFASAEGEGGTPTEQTPTTSRPTTTAPAPTETGGGGGGGAPQGDPAAGKEVFTTAAQPPCAGCHTLAEANATGQVGPNLDDALKGKTPEFIHESIVDPDAEITAGFQGGIMPATYGDQLSEKQLDDLVAFLVRATSG